MFKLNKKIFIKNEKGQALVQFVLLFPVLFIMLSMVVDTWRVVDAKMLVQSAASESALYMVEKSDNPGTIADYIENVLYNESKGRLDKSKLKVNITNYGGEKTEKHIFHSNYHDDKGTPFNYVYNDKKVVVEYEVKLIMPLSKFVFGGETVKVKSDFITRVGKK